MLISQIPLNNVSHVIFPPPPPPPDNYIYETLPIPVVGSTYQTVPLSTILTQEFGKNLDGYTNFYIGYFGLNGLTAYPDWMSFWSATPTGYNNWVNGKGPAPGVVTRWVSNNSVIQPANFDEGPGYTPKIDYGDPNLVHATAANMADFSLEIGTNIAPFEYILVPIAYDSYGNPTQFVQYSITTADPSLASSTLGTAPKASDVVAAAERFAADQALCNVKSPNDCEFIAQDVAAAAGAALSDNTESGNPAQNQPGGYWRIAYRGSDPGALQNWSSLVEPGDIVRMGWEGGGLHTFTVAAVNPVANSDGTHNLEVYDNATTHNLIQLHWDTGDGNNTLNEGWTYDAAGVGDPSEITIYRLSPDHLYLIQGSNPGSWLAGNGLNDDIVGVGGHNFLVGGAGNNVLDGGSGGNNTAVFFGPRSEYDISSYTDKNGVVHTVIMDTGKAGDGTDDMINIERVQFSDWTYALSGATLTQLGPTLNNSDSPPPVFHPPPGLGNGVLPATTQIDPGGPIETGTPITNPGTLGSTTLLAQSMAAYGGGGGAPFNTDLRWQPHGTDQPGFLAGGSRQF